MLKFLLYMNIFSLNITSTSRTIDELAGQTLLNVAKKDPKYKYVYFYTHITVISYILLVFISLVNLIPIIFGIIYLPCEDGNTYDCNTNKDAYILSMVVHILHLILGNIPILLHLHTFKKDENITVYNLKILKILHIILSILAFTLVGEDIYYLSSYPELVIQKIILYPTSNTPTISIYILVVIILIFHVLSSIFDIICSTLVHKFAKFQGFKI